MITPQIRAPLDIVPFRQGLGWWVGDAPNAWMGKAAYWNGDTVNFHTFLRWLPELGLGVFVSVNTTTAVSVRGQLGVRALGLMVTAKTGRRAPSLPRTSPVVRVSARTLRRAAGRYATDTGVDVVKVSGGALRWTPAAQPPGTPSFRVLPRADGWYTPVRPRVASPEAAASIKPVTVAGRRLLLLRFNSQYPYSGVMAVAEKIPSTYRIPKAWKDRTGSYRAINIIPRTYPGVPRVLSLRIDDGVLLWGGSNGGVVLVPAGPRRAFTFGFAPLEVETGAGDVLTAAGNTLTLFGLTYRKIGR